MRIPSVSIIIPIYKVEKYLKRCIESAREQTLSDLEIILVDDGSPDQCPEICDDYAKLDIRIKVIHKENGGLSSARNAGMRIATGKYIFFLDSDDWLESDGMQRLYETAEKYQVDFVRYRAIRTGWPGMEANAPCMVEEIRELQEGLYDKKRIINEIYPRLLATPQLTMGAIVGAWGSLYRTDFLRKNQLSFYEEVKFSEDLIFSANVVRAANSFYFIDTPGVYHYFYNPNSISKSFREGRWDSCKSLIHYCEKDFANDTTYDFKRELYYLRWFCIMLALNERKYLKGYSEKREYCKKLLNDPVIRRTKLRLSYFNVTWKQKVVMILVRWKMSGFLARL
ncbi:glycosyltransferase [Faecalicatena contorta]|uniref:glycosyltransferase n=1 Tax=Faecalicatena contorta TaxID=39482 RepID=UPI001F2A62FF|nr:glycosyltransferase [Faecalicatena contorta]MCF2669400.1 glycosyltransferase [Faecalicatena contorta]